MSYPTTNGKGAADSAGSRFSPLVPGRERIGGPFGRRAIDAELKGYPVRIEVGPRDIAESRVVMVRRVTGERVSVPVDSVVSRVTAALGAGQKTLYEEALAQQRQRTADVTRAGAWMGA